jgi:hypothetical protein
MHPEISQAENAGSRAETLDRDREVGRSAAVAQARRSAIAAEGYRSVIASEASGSASEARRPAVALRSAL